MTKKNIIILLLTLSSVTTHAQKVINLYQGKAPGSENWNWQEKQSAQNMFNTLVVYNVVNPTLTAYLPDPAIANGTAVIVCPGGAFHTLAINNEGIDVAKWLNKKGIVAFVLRYRLVHSVTDDPVKELLPKMMGDRNKFDQENDSVVTMAVADGKKAIEYVRSHAAEYKVNPAKIGIMGFSAGGTITVGVGLSYTAENRPDFLAPVYPYMGAIKNTTVPKDAPPVFICAATDDQLGLASHSSNLYNLWIAAGKPAELHMYARGGHGFGMRENNIPTDTWIERFYEWLQVQGLTSTLSK